MRVRFRCRAVYLWRIALGRYRDLNVNSATRLAKQVHNARVDAQNYTAKDFVP
ncbi:hypothetical protein BCR44DRAFT_1437445 [Catenaria anguillulae PL171]|uniref:Uncharacterized protein n=1 Tax=Catenaria anguillulae PL171 TaxID=765915 RepID=A0A1Y2HLN1_9FUNG|nr:hypothetical protein BCR44DRAFT_1437445 [Catenaria anguillulae PL171]